MLAMFTASIHSKTKIHITFYSKQDGFNKTRLCAPMDYGAKRQENTKDFRDKFHSWDYESGEGGHPLSLAQDQIISMEISEEIFDPAEFVTWPTRWRIARDWGVYS